MRNVILFCLISVVGFTSHAQYRLIDKSKSWNVLKSYKDQKTVCYKFLSDTILDDKKYTTLFYSFSDRLDTAEMMFAGFLREDTAKGNVYIRFINNEEFIIYSFKATTCEIVGLPAYNLASRIYFEVEFVDSTVIYGVKKKRIFLTSLDKSLSKDQIWIEGIGSNVGLIESGEVQYGRYWSKLLCVKDSSGLLWGNRKGICYIISGSNANKIAIKKNKRKNAKAKLLSFDFELKNLFIRIISVNGKVVKYQEMKTRKDQTVYHLKNGTYLFEIVDKFNKIYYTKKLTINLK